MTMIVTAGVDDLDCHYGGQMTMIVTAGVDDLDCHYGGEDDHDCHCEAKDSDSL